MKFFLIISIFTKISMKAEKGSLEYLDLSFNQFETLPSHAFKHLKKLRVLQLQHNLKLR